ncbi:MAG: molybdopterin cofactor-binding domain-containing protein [Sphaerochaetaceae bacterium]|nr:molybdopterin-dependent oxidoreductase [Sphaerochaetaceae bacterium]
MAEKSTKVASESQTIHGIIIRANIDSGSILGVTLPKPDKRFVLLEAKDVIGKNVVSVAGDELPLFASTDITYKGQPIFALFGPDAEAVEVKSREIEIDFQLTPTSQTQVQVENKEPLTCAWGNLDEAFKQGETVIERTYTDRQTWTREDTILQVTTWVEDDLLKIEIPTQWPFHVRDTVAQICGRTQKSVVVYPQPHFSAKDEKLLLPSMLAAMAALATLKLQARVQMISRFPTYKSAITITRKTALDAKGKPIGEKVKAQINQGAYALFTTEMLTQALAGLFPLYQLSAFSAEVQAVTSHAPPSHFFGDLGYSSTLFSSEAHASAIARHLQMNPANWRIKHYGEGTEQNSIVETLPITKLRDLIGDTCKKADFARHSAVYELQRRAKHPLSAFLNYSRGIGLACGAGISGFSTDSALHTAAKIEITLEANNRVIVNTSFYPTKKITSLWRTIIINELSLEKETVIFVENDTMHMVDTGPEVLSLDVERSVMMITRCCEIIKRKRFKDPLPITESVSAKSILSSSKIQFSSKNWGCLVLQLEINTIKLEVEARRIWGRFSFSNTPDTKKLQVKFKHIINSSLHENNIIPVFRKGSPPLMDIEIDTVGEQAYPSSATSALRAMVMAACASALSQALNCDVCTMPVSNDDIISYIRRQNEN